MKYHKELTLEKWYSLPKQNQILNICAEISRTESWQNVNETEKSRECIERAMELLDLTVQDKRWEDKLADLLRIREALGYFYLHPGAPIILRIFYDWLSNFAAENQ